MTLKLHHLRPAPGAKTPKTRVGRGEGSKGKTAGRGTKGTKARNQVPASFEGGQMPIHMRLPKLKGFKNPFKVEFQVVNLDRLGELFPDGGEVTVQELVNRGAVRKGHPVKVLGQGDISVSVQVSANAFSGSAREKIEAAGGTATVIAELEAPEAPAPAPKKRAAKAPAAEPEASEPEAVVEDAEPEADEAAADEPEA
jgi:large subunit ribosomal protein L15